MRVRNAEGILKASKLEKVSVPHFATATTPTSSSSGSYLPRAYAVLVFRWQIFPHLKDVSLKTKIIHSLT